MRTSLRATAAATLIAIAATTAVAAATDAAPSHPTETVTAARPNVRATTHETPATLPAVTTSDVDQAVLAAAQSGVTGEGQSVVQTIELTVLGGELELVTDHATVTLERVPGSSRDWTGTLPPVRVIDARGTHEGWTVQWSVAEVSVPRASGRVRLSADEPTVVAGLEEGLVAGNGRTLFRAKQGYGGGTYEAGGTVTLRLPRRADADEVVVDLTFTLD